MSILDLFKKKPKVNGIIKYLKLEGWWLNELSDEEREIILNIYSPMGSENSIIEGEIYNSSQTQLHFFWGLIGWFNKPELRHIAYKLISKAETFIDKSSESLDVHFFYSTKLEVFYKDRDLRPNGLELAIQSCEQQIANAPAAATAFKQKYDGNLPAHKGYSQLAIILEKQKRYDEAISLCEKAKSQGWAGDWDKRLERCDKRAKA
nr:tetratricopeptide repeat protein [uncultured Halomonas sp.]